MTDYAIKMRDSIIKQQKEISSTPSKRYHEVNLREFAKKVLPNEKEVTEVHCDSWKSIIVFGAEDILNELVSKLNTAAKEIGIKVDAKRVNNALVFNQYPVFMH